MSGTVLSALCAVWLSGMPGLYASTKEQGQALSQRFLAGDAEAIWLSAGPGLKQQMGDLKAFRAFITKAQGDFGKEMRLLHEEVTEKGLQQVYSRYSLFSQYARGVELQWVLGPENTVEGVSFRPAAKEVPAPHLGQKPMTRLKLPLEGTWTVLWGGSDFDSNRHATVSDQRFAEDLVIYKGSNTFNGDGTRNEQYFAWAQKVRAPAAGHVAWAQDDQPDNLPNQPSTATLYGNHVVIDHGNGEFSLLAHLKSKSVKVKRGESVKAGDWVADVGNSGTSTEPHLHFQLMDSPRWLEAHGLPLLFESVVLDGKKTTATEPRKGQTVANATN